MVANPASPVALTPLDLADPKVQQLTRRIFFGRGFARRLRAAGWEDEDALQEVFIGLLTRQQGRSRFNPSRSSLSHYLFVVLSSMTSNLLKRRQIRERSLVSIEADAGMDTAVPPTDLRTITFPRQTPRPMFVFELLASAGRTPSPSARRAP